MPLLIIVVTALISYRGFRDHRFYEKLVFDLDRVLLQKDYPRLVTSGFLHINWMHLIFNMLTLYMFSRSLESYLGQWRLLLIYFGALIGGNLLALLIHRGHGDYRSVGASGAVNGVIFASIALFPGMGIGLFLLPISIPSWLFGLLFVGFSIYAVRSKKDNVGHEAHLGGALVGMLIALLLVPAALMENYLPILVVTVPVILFMYVVAYRPHLLLVNNLHYDSSHRYTIDQRYNMERAVQQHEIDRILEKIHRKGMKSLTKKEKEQLEAYSKKTR